MMARRDRTDMTSGSVLGALLALLIAIGGTLLMAHWMACSQEPGTALCVALPMAMRHPLQHLRARVRVWFSQLRRWWLLQRLQTAQHYVRHWKRVQLEDAQSLLDAEDRVIELQRAIHHLGRR